MSKVTFRTILVFVIAAGLALGATSAFSQNYPSRPIILICPYAPGAGIDLVARIIGQRLNESMGYNIVIRNQPGASGNIGADAAANAPPDGYTLVIIANAQILNKHLAKNVRDASKDFAPVAPAGKLPFVLGVSSSLPVRSIAELVVLARAKPGEINFSGVAGSITHLLGVLLGSNANVDIRFVSYKSSNDAVADVLTGRVPIWITTVASALPFVKSGAVRILGVTGERRLPMLPDAPTMREAGFPALDEATEFYVLAPAATSNAIVAKLNGDITAAMGARDVREKLAALGVEPNSSTPDELAKHLQAQSVKWGEVVKLSGIRAQ